jgi:phage major head subunit gpT-like protein
MQITPANLAKLQTSFNALYNEGIGQVANTWNMVAYEVPSSTKTNTYGWMNDLPAMRKWVGDRVVNNLSARSYEIPNESFELTVGVDRDDIEDDNLGVYNMRFVHMGNSVASHPDELVWGLMKKGDTTTCYDGQYFFDTDHPVMGEDGVLGTVSNHGGGAGPGWYLIDDSNSFRPIIYQNRRAPQFVNKDKPEDDDVFNKKLFKYGVDKRCNVGFGFWQKAYYSKQAMTPDNFFAAFQAMAGMKGENGRPLRLRPTKVVVPPGLMKDATTVLSMDSVNIGGVAVSNPAKGLVQVVMESLLA